MPKSNLSLLDSVTVLCLTIGSTLKLGLNTLYSGRIYTSMFLTSVRLIKTNL